MVRAPFEGPSVNDSSTRKDQRPYKDGILVGEAILKSFLEAPVRRFQRVQNSADPTWTKPRWPPTAVAPHCFFLVPSHCFFNAKDAKSWRLPLRLSSNLQLQSRRANHKFKFNILH